MPSWRLILAGVLVLQLGDGVRSSSVLAAGVPWEWYPKVSIVWPHDAAGYPIALANSNEVNVSVWPTVESAGCATNPGLSLWIAYDNDPAGPLSPDIEGHLISRQVAGTTFPSLEFNDVPLNLAANPTARFTIMAGRYTGPYSNVWVHALDPRTSLPNPIVPTGYGVATADTTGSELDSRIQIVFPHDAQGREMTVSQALFVNIAVDVFIHGTFQSVPPDFDPDGLTLEEAVGNDFLREPSPLIRASKTTYLVGGQVYPRWVFNDVSVQPGQQYHFLTRISNNKIASPYSNVWTHAADARTILPNPSPPPTCTP
jgi:hypothetical protein